MLVRERLGLQQPELQQHALHAGRCSKDDTAVAHAVLDALDIRGLEHALAVNIVEPIDDNVSPQMASNFNPNEVMKYVDFGDWDLFMAGVGSYDLLGHNGEIPQNYGQGPSIT